MSKAVKGLSGGFGLSSAAGGVKKTFLGGAEDEAGKRAESAALAGVEEQRRQFDLSRQDFQEAQERFQPFEEAGLGALEQQQRLLGLSGVGQQRQAFQEFKESPGQQFLRERGEKSLLRNASAIGGLGGGNVRSALQEQGIGFAQQDFQNQLNRLAGLSGTGQQAVQAGGQLTSQQAALGAQSAAGIAQGLQSAGQARATGIIGKAAGQREGISQFAQLAGAFSDLRLKENIVKIGELSSGLGWYTWDWTEEGKLLANDQITEGVIAQEAAEKFPDAIGEHKGFMTVNYEGIH